ncbi:MAG TPA: hypothetical protein VFQ91_13345 [Bryobacteraceae bacterium]|nr:hypothetical protein [Bryobacteraceae bacterium]
MAAPRVLRQAPVELTEGPLRRLGEGIGKVVYASAHWVVKRPRTPSEVVALILLWKWLPRPFLRRPSRRLRLLRISVEAVMKVVPRSVWLSTHVKDVWRLYFTRDRRGERLARTLLDGTSFVPEVIAFPPVRVEIGGWPGFLTVSEATARVEATLDEHLAQLAARHEFAEIALWLERFLELRQSAWRRGLFSLDAHLKNYGIAGDRIVLLDSGGLTDRWTEVRERLIFEEVVAQPHVQLGLGATLAGCPQVAETFDARWKELVNRKSVRNLWPKAG